MRPKITILISTAIPIAGALLLEVSLLVFSYLGAQRLSSVTKDTALPQYFPQQEEAFAY